MLKTGMHKLWQSDSLAAWLQENGENEEIKRKWRENEEMERYLLSTFPHFLAKSP